MQPYHHLEKVWNLEGQRTRSIDKGCFGYGDAFVDGPPSTSQNQAECCFVFAWACVTRSFASGCVDFVVAAQDHAHIRRCGARRTRIRVQDGGFRRDDGHRLGLHHHGEAHMVAGGLLCWQRRAFCSPANLVQGVSLLVRASDFATASPSSVAAAISLTEKALSHLSKLRASQDKELCLRVGVRQGGCSGMSYVMDFEETSNLRPDDSIIDYEGFKMVCDPKSLLFLYGMQLDYSDALIGGGFSFSNPNASSTCGCGKSFAA